MPFPNPDTQFKPGRSGNPGGRPKGRSLIKLLRRLVNEPGRKLTKADLETLTNAEVLMFRLIQGGRKGDIQYIKEILDRLEGKAQPAAPKGEKSLRDITSLLDPE